MRLPTTELEVPAHSSATLFVVVEVSANGTYHLTAHVDSGTVQASDTATLIVGEALSPVYRPIVRKNAP